MTQITGIRALPPIFLRIVELWQPEDEQLPSEPPLLGGVISVLTVKKLCLGQNRQGVSSKLKKTRQLELVGNSNLAEFSTSQVPNPS